jgi:micrococcal nuclease
MIHDCAMIIKAMSYSWRIKMSTHTNMRLTSKLYYYAADVTAVYDGDTITVNLDLGLGIWRNGQTIRLWKIDTPELRGPEKADGLRVRDMVRDLILDKSILLRTILDKRGTDSTGKYGRLLGEVLVPNARGALINVNDLLLGLGSAVPMGTDGTHISALPSPATAAATRASAPASRTASTAEIIPEAIACPFCGESRHITQEPHPVDNSIALVEQCPNCLDGACPYHEFLHVAEQTG